MLVERRDHLDALRTVVDLVEQAPQQVGFVACAVPPVEHERGDEVGDQAAGRRPQVARQME
jgi:hypothetical protein